MSASSAIPAAPRQAGRQAGFTLIEILVALFIALFLLGGLLTIEQNVRNADLNQTALTQLQDEERLGMSMLNDVIQIAGYFPDPSLYSADDSTYFGAFTPANTQVSLAVGQMIGGTTGGSNSSDTIVVRYMSSGMDGIISCTGSMSTGVAGFVNVFTVNTFTLPNGQLSGQLLCSPDGVSAAVPLVNGVTQLSALYGVTTTGTTNSVDTYLTASQVTMLGLWGSVIAVKVTLTFANPLYGQPGYTNSTVSFSRVIDLQNQVGINTT